MYIIVEHYKPVLLKENLMKTRGQQAKNLVYTLHYQLKIMQMPVHNSPIRASQVARV